MTFMFEFTIEFKVKKNMTIRFEFSIGFKVKKKKKWSLGLNLPLGLKLKKKIWLLGLNLPLDLKLKKYDIYVWIYHWV